MKNFAMFSLFSFFVFAACTSQQQATKVENEVLPIQTVSNTIDDRQVSLNEALKTIEDQNGVFARMLSHGSMFVGLYTPKVEDKQTPHKKDEVYIIMEGTGEFLNGTTTTSFKPGDVIFVPAEEAHRFLNFSEDFKAWVVFYGPEGGEEE